MKTIIIFLAILLALTACSEDKVTKQVSDYVQIIKNKNFSLTQNDALKYFYHTKGIDKETNQPNAEVEYEYFNMLSGSKEHLLIFKDFTQKNILKITDTYIFALVNLDKDYDTLAATFKLDGTPINLLLIEKSFGTNEFSIQRTYTLSKDNNLLIKDKRYDVQWIVHPTKGINKLTSESATNITVDEKGFFSSF